MQMESGGNESVGLNQICHYSNVGVDEFLVVGYSGAVEKARRDTM